MRDRFLFRNIWERFQWTFQNLFTCDILFVHLCLCMYIGHKTWTFSTFINCAILIKTLGFFFFSKMVSRSPSNVLRGKQTETGAKQPRPRETGVFLQLRCYTDDWQPSAVDTQLPRWLFRSSVPTPSKAHI